MQPGNGTRTAAATEFPTETPPGGKWIAKESRGTRLEAVLCTADPLFLLGQEQFSQDAFIRLLTRWRKLEFIVKNVILLSERLTYSREVGGCLKPHVLPIPTPCCCL